MKPVTPPLHEGAKLVTFGKAQPELYFALPASVDADGTVMTEWEFSAEDLARIVNGGRVRLWLLHTDVQLGRLLTPILLEIIE